MKETETATTAIKRLRSIKNGASGRAFVTTNETATK